MMSITEEGESSGVGDQDELLASRISSKYHPLSLSLSRRGRFLPKHCIFRLPERFMNINDMSLKPQVVAIGPYCYQRYGQLQKMDEVKWQCLNYFLKVHTSTLNSQEYMVQCLRQMRLREDEIRGCYSENVMLNTDDLLEMMVVDGFFILYVLLYRRVFAKVHNNPLFRLERIVPKIYTDLLLLENQIPFLVLQELYDMCEFKTDISLPKLIETAISEILLIPQSVANVNSQPKWLHLLHFVRSIFSQDYYDGNNEYNETFNVPLTKIPCVTKLGRVGIEVIQHKTEGAQPTGTVNFLKVTFNGVAIEIPKLTLDNAMCSFLVNCVAFEQCYNCSTRFSIYITFLKGLVNTEQDAEYLCDQCVIENFFGTNTEITHFINNLSKDLHINLIEQEFYLVELFEDVDKYYQKRFHWANRHLMNLKREYFGKPWLWFSAFAGLLFFIITLLQTIYTIFAYEHPKH